MSSQPASVTVTRLHPDDSLVGDVMRLWRRHSETLGFFPEGAFRDYASRGQILVATPPGTGLVGYLAYRRSGTRVAVIHLCVDPGHRGGGIAKLLVERLVTEAGGAEAITLRCRRDYEVSKLWPRLQFEPVNELPGRAGVLVVWRRDLGAPDLFRRRTTEPSKVRAVIDANVFFDFQDPTRQGGESQALLADWLEEVVELTVTPELLNEILRKDDADLRAKHRAAASQFAKCEEPSPGAYTGAVSALTACLPPATCESDESDRRQLAWAVASQAEYFLTRDDELLTAADAVFARTGVSVMRPMDLILKLDEIQREHEYAPARLAGTRLRWARGREGIDERLADTIHFGLQGETRAAFLSQVRGFSSDPQRFELRYVRDGETPIALLVLDRIDSDALSIRMMRIGRVRAGSTLARHLLFRAQYLAATEGRGILTFEDPVLDQEIESALVDESWLRSEEGKWHRWTVRFVGAIDDFVEVLRRSPILARPDARRLVAEVDHLLASARDGDVSALARAERLLWPAKVLGTGLPTFMIPIKPSWAQHIVDDRLAHEELFGAREDLALNREAVYYRSPQRPAPTAPSRVVWYVSDDGASRSAKAVRACSAIDDVEVCSGREAHRKYRRFGVFEWRDIKASMNPEGDVMALRFSNTELLPKPVSLDDVRTILGRQGKGVMTAGPMPLDDAAFAAIYRAGGFT